MNLLQMVKRVIHCKELRTTNRLNTLWLWASATILNQNGQFKYQESSSLPNDIYSTKIYLSNIFKVNRVKTTQLP